MKIKMAMPSQLDVFKRSKFIHIGDDFEKDYEGATKIGFEALHLVREGEDADVVDGANTITDLSQAAVTIRIIAEQELGRSDP